MTTTQLKKVRLEFVRQLATLKQALARLEWLDSELTGRCFVTEQVKRTIRRGDKLQSEISRKR